MLQIQIVNKINSYFHLFHNENVVEYIYEQKQYAISTWIHHLQIEMTRVHIPFWHTWGHGELDKFSDVRYLIQNCNYLMSTNVDRLCLIYSFRYGKCKNIDMTPLPPSHCTFTYQYSMSFTFVGPQFWNTEEFSSITTLYGWIQTLILLI